VSVLATCNHDARVVHIEFRDRRGFEVTADLDILEARELAAEVCMNSGQPVRCPMVDEDDE
jgi:hypothetical protein